LDHARPVSLRPFARIHHRKRAAHEEVRLRVFGKPSLEAAQFDIAVTR
jgi:hypothetical protein